MKKLLILPAILAMTTLSGSAFAQRGSSGSVGGSPYILSVTTNNGSVVTNIPAPSTPVGTVTINNQGYFVVPGLVIGIGAPPSSGTPSGSIGR